MAEPAAESTAEQTRLLVEQIGTQRIVRRAFLAGLGPMDHRDRTRLMTEDGKDLDRLLSHLRQSCRTT